MIRVLKRIYAKRYFEQLSSSVRDPKLDRNGRKALRIRDLMQLVAAGIVYAVNTSISAAELVSAGSIMFLLFDIAGWLVSATSYVVSAGSLQSCWYNNAGIPAEFLAEDARARIRFEEEQASERLVQRIRAEDLAQEDLPNVFEERAKELDDLMMRMTETDWLTLMMQVGSNPALARELLGADVNEENFIERMHAVKEKKKRALADLRYRALKGKPMKKSEANGDYECGGLETRVEVLEALDDAAAKMSHQGGHVASIWTKGKLKQVGNDRLWIVNFYHEFTMALINCGGLIVKNELTVNDPFSRLYKVGGDEIGGKTEVKMAIL
ncbi:hypothetical protein Tco_1009021 [Tanacetum coccineum]